jgi:glycosyltransferase involved in cell wall biosynthesis/peptidoglycan/xylan/chitin deacetylase (PgdA/CDA1 family)
MVQSTLYYHLKPLIPRRVQIALRRRVVRKKLPSCTGVWPIDERAATPPPGWRGWPDGKKFAFVITHDVETARGHERAYRLAKLDRELGFRSSFNFVPEGYRVSDVLRHELVKYGFEVGVHGLTHRAQLYTSKDKFSKKVDRIKHYLKEWDAVGFRTPSMYHNLDWYHDLELEYDASTFDTDPFEPQPDSAGTIFPFWVPPGSGGGGYVELPYTLPQDFMLYVLMGEPNTGIWKSKLDWIAQCGGMAMLLVHPDYINFDGKRRRSEEYPTAFYRDFLEHVKTKYEGQYWHALPREVARFWKGQYVSLQPAVASPVTSHQSPVTNLRSPVTSVARRPLRVCMLVYSFYESDNRVLRYAETLAKRGDAVDVIALRKDGQPVQDSIRGVNVFRVQERIKNERSQLTYVNRLMKFFFKSAVLLNKQHKRKPYDLVHVHNMPDFLVFAALLPKLQGAKIILDIHDVVPELYATMFGRNERSLLFKVLVGVEKVSGAFANQVIVANHIWQETVTSRSVKEDKCSVVLNYPDENVFFPRVLQRGDDKFLMIYPGSLSLRQGVDIAIRAVSLLRDELPSAEFHIYGDGAGREYLESLVSELGLEDRVLFKGSLPIYEVAEKMAQADLGIEPKRNDMFAGDAMSTKILEFMTSGVPVIASDTRVHKHYFNESVLKFFRSDDPEDLANKIRMLARDGALRHRLAVEAARLAADFVWEKNKQAYLGLVDSLADSSK